MPECWLNGVITFLHKKKDMEEIQNYRPITLITIIYKIWKIMTKRRSTFMNLLTNEQQCAYKQGRSTIDILSLIQNNIQQDKTKKIIIVDLSKAFDSIDRDAMWTISYQQGPHGE